MATLALPEIPETDPVVLAAELARPQCGTHTPLHLGGTAGMCTTCGRCLVIGAFSVDYLALLARVRDGLERVL